MHIYIHVFRFIHREHELRGMSAKPSPPEKVSASPVTPEPPETTRRRGCIRHSRAEGGAAGPSQPESRCANRCGGVIYTCLHK